MKGSSEFPTYDTPGPGAQGPSWCRTLRDHLLLCGHPRKAVREEALNRVLLFLEDGEPRSYGHLLEAVSSLGPESRLLPPILWRVLCDWMALVHRPGPRTKARDPVRDFLNKPSGAFFSCLFHRPVPLGLWADFLPPVFFFPGTGRSVSVQRTRWRLLRNRVRRTGSPPWAEPTCRDLLPLWRKKAPRRGRPVPSGRWLRIGRPVLMAPAGNEKIRGSFPGLRQSYWAGCGDRLRSFLDGLIRCQERELALIRDLARTVSLGSRQVVLSWHNATLAAAGGWAFESIEERFPSRCAWEDFKKRVKGRLRDARGRDAARLSRMADLWEERKKRLLAPKVVHVLWEGRFREAVDPGWAEEEVPNRRLARALFPAEELLEGPAMGRFHWSGIRAPHQKDPREETAAVWLDAGPRWTEGLLRLLILVEEAQGLLDRGTLDWFVLPWIDKFFISSLRELDHEYLGLLFDLLRDSGIDPLVLLWEDTARVQSPSLQIALDRLASRGYPFRGIGIFHSGGVDLRDAPEIILEEQATVRLFALRPLFEGGRHRSFQELLGHPDPGFFREYNSSWKDNLCFLYAGTQVRPLVSLQWETEPFPAWIALPGGKLPFGRFLRQRLRRQVPGKENGNPDPFALDYARWANLL
ncbi:MAG TPA: hypothetical protein PLM79_14975 [Syntrophobacteraceae bacterium]|nr:hypothetical protein [Syntrophobacteraceae bacterium]